MIKSDKTQLSSKEKQIHQLQLKLNNAEQSLQKVKTENKLIKIASNNENENESPGLKLPQIKSQNSKVTSSLKSPFEGIPLRLLNSIPQQKYSLIKPDSQKKALFQGKDEILFNSDKQIQQVHNFEGDFSEVEIQESQEKHLVSLDQNFESLVEANEKLNQNIKLLFSFDLGNQNSIQNDSNQLHFESNYKQQIANSFSYPKKKVSASVIKKAETPWGIRESPLIQKNKKQISPIKVSLSKKFLHSTNKRHQSCNDKIKEEVINVNKQTKEQQPPQSESQEQNLQQCQQQQQQNEEIIDQQQQNEQTVEKKQELEHEKIES